MKRGIIFFIKYFLYWLCFFILFKALFLIINHAQTSQLDLGTIIRIFAHGSIMDLSAAGYLTVLPGLFLMLTPFVKSDIIFKAVKWYTIVMLIYLIILGLTDISLYPYWGTRVNGQLIPYLKEPTGIISSVSFLQALIAVGATAVILFVSIWCFNRLFRNTMDSKKAPWYSAPVILFLTAALIIPVRGGFNTSPLNFSSVYFHPDIFPNHAAYNFFWSFNHALMHQKDKTNPVHYFDGNDFEKNLQGIKDLNQEQPHVYIKSAGKKPVNVVLVILESFSDKVIETLGGMAGVTPCLNKLSNEGILFSSFYATGTRSDKGISALLASYPSLIKVSSVVLYPEKMKKLSYMPKYFRDKGYSLSFYYGGDVNFYNTSMLLTQSGVMDIVSRNDFPLNVATIQKWGVPDGYLYDRVSEDLVKMKEPFFNMVYTVSSHEPFDVPFDNKMNDNSSTGKYCNAVTYADSCLGAFVDRLKASPLWENTLLIITSDHAALEPGPTTFADPATYRIPMLWTGGVIDTAFVCNNISMQNDLSSTLIQQLGWKPEPSYFSKNIFGSRHYAFFLHDEGWGFFSPEAGFFENIKSDTQSYMYGEQSTAKDSLTLFAKSFVQYLHNDFLAK